MSDECLTGSVENIVYCNDENGYSIARLQVASLDDLITIVGTMPTLAEGELITCRGNWSRHPKFGQQFQVDNYETERPSDLRGIQKYLESGLIRGIGEVYAERIVQAFGTRTLEVIEDTPYRLREVEGIGAKRLESIIESWNAQREIREVMIFLQTYGIRPSIAHKTYKVYGDGTLTILKENPYLLARTVFGVGFKRADEIAEKIGIAKDSQLRLEAGVKHVLDESASDGHVCVSKETLLEHSSGLLEHNTEAALDGLVAKGAVVVSDLGEGPLVWLQPYYRAELGIAREMYRLKNATAAIRPVNQEKAIEWVEEQTSLKLADEQKKAIELALEEKVLIITGGPGTGKSTITRAILKIIEKLTASIHLAAPTGRAAKRMSEITRHSAQTIHALLEVDFTKGGFKKNKEAQLTTDLLIVDEASMIDTALMHHLLLALPSTARLILLGDIDQLPSVGPGNVLRDLIESETVPTIRLKRIFRQSRGSKIITSAHSVNAGFIPKLERKDGDDFFFIEKEDPEEIATTILDLVRNRLPKSYNFDPFTDIQVLCPMKKGTIGTENLCSAIQEAINPSDSPLSRMGQTFHLGDKVMQIRNNYDKKVFNGDMGRISAIHPDEKLLEVTFYGRRIDYSFSDLDEITVAYAVSVHKYQGSECPCIILPVHTQHFKLLQRNLLYTGITRGRKLVILIGTKKALALAIKTAGVAARTTGLQLMIKKVGSRTDPIS